MKPQDDLRDFVKSAAFDLERQKQRYHRKKRRDGEEYNPELHEMEDVCMEKAESLEKVDHEKPVNWRKAGGRRDFIRQASLLGPGEVIVITAARESDRIPEIQRLARKWVRESVGMTADVEAGIAVPGKHHLPVPEDLAVLNLRNGAGSVVFRMRDYQCGEVMTLAPDGNGAWRLKEEGEGE